MTVVAPGCFGKLPIFADFIQHNAGGPALQALDQLFQEGIYLARESLGDEWNEGYPEAPPVRFLYRPDGSSQCLAGVSVPGRDNRGRTYPFTVFLTVDETFLHGEVALVPAIFGDFFGQAQELGLRGWADREVADVIESVAALPTEVSVGRYQDEYKEFLRREKAGSFWSNVTGDFESPSKYRILENLHEAVRILRNGGPGLGLKFPLSAGSDSPDRGWEVSFWMDATLRAAEHGGTPALVYWTDGETKEDHRFYLFTESTPPLSILPMIRPDYRHDRIFDLAEEDPGDMDALRDRYGALLEKPDLDLGEMLGEMKGCLAS